MNTYGGVSFLESRVQIVCEIARSVIFFGHRCAVKNIDWHIQFASSICQRLGVYCMTSWTDTFYADVMSVSWSGQSRCEPSKHFAIKPFNDLCQHSLSGFDWPRYTVVRSLSISSIVHSSSKRFLATLLPLSD